jgi:membrane protein YqaA with SNARE-associated domain
VTRLPAWATSLPLALGGSGLLIVAFLDASFFSLPEINDILVVFAVVKQPALFWYYALMATAGSVFGTYALFAIGRKGGEAFLVKRVDRRHLDRIRRLCSRRGTLGVFIASLLPPPTPFKLIVLVGAVSGMRRSSLIFAVAAGRGLRYFAEGLLACWIGERAIDRIRDNGASAGVAVTALALTAALGWFLWRAWLGRRGRPAES